MEVEANGDDAYMDRSSNTIVIHLTKGQRVWPIRAGDSNVTIIQGDLRSSFTGALISPDPVQ